MSTTIKLDSKARLKIQKMVSRPFKNIRQFWGALALMVDRDTMLTFRGQGARGGMTAWAGYSPATLRTRAGTWNIRYGTDMKGRAPGTYTPGKLRKGIRRYSGTSKLLQASAGFRNSFGVIKIGRERLLYGTRHELAEDIMSVKDRQVLFITGQDEQRYATQFKTWYLKGLRI